MEIFLFLIILALCVLLYLQQRAFSKQQVELLNAIIAKSSKEYIEIKNEDKPKIQEKEIFPDPLLEDVPDDQFEEVITKDLEVRDE